jgi:hypothetical protein
MKHIILISALALVASAAAQTVSLHTTNASPAGVAGSTSASMTMPMKVALPVIPSEGIANLNCSVEMHLRGFVPFTSTNASSDVDVTFANTGTKPAEITHVGTSPICFIKLSEPIVVVPGKEAHQIVTVSSNAQNGLALTAFALIKQDGVSTVISKNIPIQFGDVPVADKQALIWGLGEKLDEKSIAINLPGSAKIAKARVSNGFSVRVDGSTVYVKPVSTTKSATTSIVLTFEPALRPNLTPQIFAAVLNAPASQPPQN